MRLYDFLSKDEQLQYQIVWEIGKHIETLYQDGTMYLLYAINNFFVEVQYSQKNNQISVKTNLSMEKNLINICTVIYCNYLFIYSLP